MTAEMAEGLKIKGGGAGSKDETGFASISGIWGENCPLAFLLPPALHDGQFHSTQALNPFIIFCF